VTPRAAILLAALVLVAGCEMTGGGRGGTTRRVTALVGGRVHAAPAAAVIADGVVLVDGASILAVGPRAEVRVPADATVLDCSGATVLAGFWNSHVHFIASHWQGAETAPAEQLAGALQAMLTSYGVVGAVDTGSRLPDTLALRRRVESGEIPGPAILTVGSGFAPEGGSPYYVLPTRIPELTVPGDVAKVEAELDRGADLVKLFTGSFARPDSIVVMPVDVVRAVTEMAHRRHTMVFAHPSNSAGARAAIEGGVDVLAHTFPTELDRRPWDQALPGMMIERRMALIPTLKLFPTELAKAGLPARVVEFVVGVAKAQLRAFADGGGQVLFGTDVGYVADYDPTDEYVLMQEAGLSYPRILASLTTAPAERFGRATHAGRLRPGADADIAVVEGDPERDIRALAAVRYTLRAGRVIYRRAT
jgi:imidazolonepropionase-like amidohydrolase